MSERVMGSSIIWAGSPLRSFRCDRVSRKAATRSQALRWPVVIRRSRVAARSVRDGLIKREAQLGVSRRDPMQRGERHRAEFCRLQRLRVHNIFALEAKADDIAGIGKSQYLAPPILEEPVQRHRAGLDPVDLFDRVALHEHEFLCLDAAKTGLGKTVVQAVWGGRLRKTARPEGGSYRS